jgi:hypothetical protein
MKTFLIHLNGHFAMRRIQFIEIHEQPWFPPFLRDDVTDVLQSGLNFLKAYAHIAPILQGTLDSLRSRSVVDLCSGGGGPWLDLSRNLKTDVGAGEILLSDKFPNLRAFQTVKAASGNRVAFCADPIDAMKVPRELRGFRTIFSSYHHFPPEDARAVLQDAVDARESIGIFEVTRRAPGAIGLMFPWAFLVFITTPWIRPFRWSRLFWTYVLPIVPFVVLFDGVVSCMRTYRPQELWEITKKLTGIEYKWEAGEHRNPGGKVPITFLIGRPREASETLRVDIGKTA